MTLLSLLFKATVILTLALAAARLARQNRAALRHLLLAAGFSGLLLVPLASVVSPRVAVRVPLPVPLPVDRALELATPPEVVSGAPLGSGSSTTHTRSLSLSAMLLTAWGLGAAVGLLPLAAGLWQVRRLRRTARPCPANASRVTTVIGESAGGRRIEVLLHASVAGPMTCGVFRPAIVLPSDAVSWPVDDLRRAIVHEMEHVRRADWLTQIMARAMCACYWFHPLVWIAWRQLVLEAERACDDAVVRRSDPAAYADQLVLLAERLSSAEQPQPAMASRHDLAARIFAVLDHNQRRGRAGIRWVALAGGVAACLAATISPLQVIFASADPATRASQAPVQRFEVASIRPCRTEEAPPGPARGGAGGTNATFSPGRMTVPCVTVEQLIYLAYAGSGVKMEDQLPGVVPGGASDTTKVRGGPAWVHSQHDKFAVEATAPGASDRYVLLGSMLRTLLEERFHLKIHRETEDAPTYNMTLAKGGLKLKPMKPGECDPDRDQPFNANGSNKPMCGSLIMNGHGPNTLWTWGGFKLQALAYRLSGALGRYVVDRTGVNDEFIIRLEFHPDENTPGIRWPEERDADTSAPQAASIFTALEEQIGVKLEKAKGQRGYLVVDYIERPSGNGGAAIFRR